MWHTVLIAAHAAAGTLAFVAGCLALRRGTLFGTYFWSLVAMVVFLALAVTAEWSLLDATTPLVFAGFVALGGFMLWRAACARSIRPASAGPSPRSMPSWWSPSSTWAQPDGSWPLSVCSWQARTTSHSGRCGTGWCPQRAPPSRSPPAWGTVELSAPLRRNVEDPAYHRPHLLCRDSRLQRVVDGAAAELGEDVVLCERGRTGGAELLLHPLPEMGESHAHQGRCTYRGGMTVLAQAGMSTEWRLVSLVILLGALTVLLRWWWQQRGR